MSFFDEEADVTKPPLVLRAVIQTTHGHFPAREELETLDKAMGRMDYMRPLHQQWLSYTPLGQPEGARATVRADTVVGFSEVSSQV